MLKKVRIAVLVSGSGTNLQALLDARGNVLNHGDVALVVSNNADAYGLVRAQKAGIPTEVVQKKDFNKLVKEAKTLKELQQEAEEENKDLATTAQ